jgi:hypothetical protein
MRYNYITNLKGGKIQRPWQKTGGSRCCKRRCHMIMPFMFRAENRKSSSIAQPHTINFPELTLGKPAESLSM